MKRFSNFVIACLLLFTSSITPKISFSQPNPACDPDDTFEECCAKFPETPACPIDGGIVGLLAAGVGYGIKKVHDSRKKSVEPQ